MAFSIIDFFKSKLKSQETKDKLKEKAEKDGVDFNKPGVDEAFNEQFEQIVNNTINNLQNNEQNANTNMPFITADILKERIDLILDTKPHDSRTLKISQLNIHSLVSKEIFSTSSNDLYNWDEDAWEFAIDYVSKNITYLKDDYYQYLFDKQTSDNKEKEKYWQEYRESGFEIKFNEENKAAAGINFDRVKIDWIKKKTQEEQIKYFGGSRAGKIRKALLDKNIISTDKDLDILYKLNDKGRKVLIPIKELILSNNLSDKGKEIIKSMQNNSN